MRDIEAVILLAEKLEKEVRALPVPRTPVGSAIIGFAKSNARQVLYFLKRYQEWEKGLVEA